ncbi:MAG: T9SS type A sorting domain-containing protein [Bacteroidota bacterium]
MRKAVHLLLFVTLIIAGSISVNAQIVPFSIPGATNTYITCTNDSSDFAGYYDYGSTATHGFIYDVSLDNIIYVDYPGATQTFIYGINNDMKTVGAYNTTGVNTDNEGFEYDYWNFTYTDLTSSWIPSMDITIARDINDADCVVGDYKESTTHVCFSMCSGTNTPFHYNYNPTYINSINNSGKRAGGWIDGSLRHGLIWDNGTWTQLDYPGATRTIFTGINDSNIIVGVYNLTHSFIYRNGVFKEISKTNATDFQIRDINNKGYIVGYYKDGSNTYKGFFSSVCEISFRPNPDGWPFNNSRPNIWPYDWYKQFDYTHDPYLGGNAPFPKMVYKQTGIIDTINRSFFPDWPLFVETLGEDQCYFNAGPVKILKYSAALKYKTLVKPWGGSCFGFVQSSFMAYDSVQRFKSAFPQLDNWDGTNKLHTLALTNNNRKCINMLMLKQSQKSYQKYRLSQWNVPPVSTLSSLKKMLLDNEKDERGITIRNQNGSGGHIVNPYKVVIDSLDPNLEYIYIYDNNFPNDTTRKITVNKTLNSWYYNLSVNSDVGASEWGGDDAHKGLFLSVPSSYWYGTPALDSVAKIDYPDESKSNEITFYNSPDCDFVITNPSGQKLGFQANQLIETMPGAIPIISESGTAEPPAGYFLPDGNYNVEMKNFSSPGAVFSVFTNTNNYSYSRAGASLSQKDKISYGTSGIAISNTDNVTKTINLSTVFENAGNEMSVEILNLGQSQNSNTAIKVLNNEIKLVNTGAPSKYDLSIRYANNAGESRFVHDTIAIAANTAHIISPDWGNLQTSDVSIFVDNGNNSTNDDTLHFANEQPPLILTFPESIVLGSAAATDTIQIINNGGGSMSWVATSNSPSWLTITGANSGSNSGFVKISTTLNNGALRSGIITFTSAGAANSPFEVAVKQNGLLAIPANVVASDGNFSDGVHLSWDAVPAATHYSVYRSSIAGTVGTALTAWITATSYIDVTAANGQVYYYTVRAAQNVSGLNTSDYSAANDGWRACFTADFNYTGTCVGQVTSFDDMSTAHTTAYYLWDINNDGTIDYSGTNALHVYNTAGNYTVKLIVTDSASCTNTVQKVVNIKAFPVVNLPSDTSVCAGQSYALNAGTGFDTYLWSTGETTSSIMADTSGYGLGCIPYYVQVSNSNGCTAIDQTSLTWIVCTGVPETVNEPVFNLYPNPTSGLLNISITGDAGKSSISIFNNGLQMVYHEEIGTINGNWFSTIDLTQMASGVYFMRFVSNNIVKVSKIIVY